MAHEINLVPDIKDEMIKTLKLRNFIFFLCIVVAASSVAVTFIVGLIMGGQQLALTSKQNTLDNLSAKLNSYSDLSDFLTFKDQLGNISTLTSNRKVFSRTFNILSALLPTGADTITISELNVALDGDQPTFSFDAQANAGKAPGIDYNVLDAFKKSMDYMRYDYGDYVDASGSTIPAYCMIETGSDGAILNEPGRGIYAYWIIDGEGCNPSKSSSSDSTEGASTATTDYPREDYGGESVVRIWRTPQYSDWVTSKNMTLDGTISGVPHFNSACITYTSDQNANNPKWTETNESCKLVPGGFESGINVTDSSNGRGASDDLVLRFSAVININPEAYSFNNHHMLALAPSGRHNVTDSFVQIQAMFGERAADCAEDDEDCKNNTTNVNGEQ